MFVQVKKKVFVGCITLEIDTYPFMLCTGTTLNLTTRYRLYDLFLIDCTEEIYYKFRF
jgi:hypothetical protein